MSIRICQVPFSFFTKSLSILDQSSTVIWKFGTANIRESSVFFRTSLTTWKVACNKKAHQFREVYDYLDVIDWPFCCGLSHISEIVFAGVLAVNKRGEGSMSGCTLLNGFFVLYVTFFLQCGKGKDAQKCDRRKKSKSHLSTAHTSTEAYLSIDRTSRQAFLSVARIATKAYLSTARTSAQAYLPTGRFYTRE